MEPLEITGVEGDGGMVFHVAGELDLLGAPQLIAAIEDADRHREDHLAIDMTRVSFLDSSGVAALLAVRQTETDGNRLVLVNPTDQALKVLELGGVVQLFEVRRETNLAP